MGDVETPVDCVVPRPTVWICAGAHDRSSSVALLEGYNVLTDNPPVLFCSASALPIRMVESIKATKKCSLSLATVPQLPAAMLYQKKRTPSSSSSSTQEQFSLSDLGLTATNSHSHPEEFPPMVESSPIRMGCELLRCVDLGYGQSILLLQVEYLFIERNVLTNPSDNISDERVRAKIEVQLIQPLASLGNGMFGFLERFYSLYRPRKNKMEQWESLPPIQLLPPTVLSGTVPLHQDIEHDFRRDGPRISNLGYNPFKAIVLPRPIGWISTFRKQGRVPHLAPYSFFCQVGSESCPMVAFSAYGPNGIKRKDAAQDAEDMKCFVYNLVSEDLFEPMNLSAAEMLPNESEFELAHLHPGAGSVVVDAPIVQEAHVRMECEYITTVENIGGFSVVVGKVVHTHVDEGYRRSDGKLDLMKLKPLARLGFADEYGVVTDYCNDFD